MEIISERSDNYFESHLMSFDIKYIFERGGQKKKERKRERETKTKREKKSAWTAIRFRHVHFDVDSFLMMSARRACYLVYHSDQNQEFFPLFFLGKQLLFCSVPFLSLVSLLLRRQLQWSILIGLWISASAAVDSVVFVLVRIHRPIPREINPYVSFFLPIYLSTYLPIYLSVSIIRNSKWFFLGKTKIPFG